ncbi:MAG: 1,2-phenylacetyl-CoA epoxidase subunit PaaC, partial [Bacteroidota bacterium]
DKIGHSLAIYTLLQQLGEADPDTLAFTRNAQDFKNCQMVELPNGEYDFSTIRHFLFDTADQLRFDMLANSSYEPLAKVARKVKGELKYHVFHANTWITKMGAATEESHIRMQHALNEAWDYALGMFEASEHEQQLISEKVFEGEAELKKRWLGIISPVLTKATLTIPIESTWQPIYGGRKGMHTEHLQPLLDEMSEVFKIDPTAEW